MAMQMGDSNQYGDFRAGDVATTLYKVSVALTDNGLLLEEIVRRLRKLEAGGVVRQHIVSANAVATTVIVALMWRSYRRNLRGALARRKNDGT